MPLALTLSAEIGSGPTAPLNVVSPDELVKRLV